MSDEENENRAGVAQYIFLGFMILITFYLTFLYIKSKYFHTYSCYNIIIMSIVIFLSTLLNIVVSDDYGTEGSECVIGIVKDFLNKIILTILTMQVITLYIGIMKTQVYYENEKKIFILGTIISAAVSLGISITFNLLKLDKDGNYHEDLDSYKDKNNIKENSEMEMRIVIIVIIESIFCGVLFVINVFCLAVVMSHLSKRQKEAEAGTIENLGYKNQLIRFIFMFILNIFAIAASAVFVIYGVFTEKKLRQTFYIGICLVIDLCYSINKTVIDETLKLFCKKGFVEKKEGQIELKRKSTFDDEEQNCDEDED